MRNRVPVFCALAAGIALAAPPAICAPQKKIQDIIVAKLEIGTRETPASPEKIRVFLAIVRNYATLKPEENINCELPLPQSRYVITLHPYSHDPEKAAADSFDVRIGYLSSDGTFYRTIIGLQALGPTTLHTELVQATEHFAIYLYRVTEKEYAVHGFDALLSEGTASPVTCTRTKEETTPKENPQP